MFKVSIIPPDLRHEETIIKAAQSLDCLQKTINSVFARIDARIARNDERVQDLSERIERANTKIKSLVGTKKAIKIYAPARFPAAHVLRDIPLTFPEPELSMEEQLENFRQERDDQNDKPQLQIKSKYVDPSPEVVKEKLVFFHVRSDELNDTRLVKERKKTNIEVGLGNPPEQVQTLSALLRFNTDEFAYGGSAGTSEDLNAWKRKQRDQRLKRLRSGTVAPKQQLPPAPHSLLNRNSNRISTPAGDLRYMPAANEAPAIDIPLDLPDLPGIAQDIQYQPVLQQSIAPSSHFLDALPELPGLTEAADVHVQLVTSNVTAQVPNIPKSTQLPNQTIAPPAPPPPPPPPPPPAPPSPPLMQTSVSVASTHQNMSSSSAIRPTSPSADTPLAITTTTANKPTTPPPDDSRSELMAAIRNAGGARGGRLRSATAAAPLSDAIDGNNLNGKTNVRNKAGDTAGDLMSDLHNKLLMRRKGISGAQNVDAQQAAGNPVLARLSSLIPPPTKPRKPKDSDDDDGDADEEWAD